jgi:hypothetical protein
MLLAVRNRITRAWPLTARGTFLGFLAVFLAVGTRLWWRDEVANALSLLLALLLVVQFVLVGLARLRLPGWIRLPETPVPWSCRDAPPQRTGWAWTDRPWWLRCGVGEPEFRPAAGIDPTDGSLRAPCPRRGEFRVSRDGSLGNSLGLVRWPVRWPDHLTWMVVPPRPLDPLPVPPRVTPAGDRWDPAGSPEGDWFDIKPAEPQTPRRLLLWKLSAKTGATETLRRAPEPVGAAEPSTGIVLLLSPEDEPAAAAVRAWLEDAAEAWVYADSSAPRAWLASREAAPGAALTRLARSGTPSSGPVPSPAEVLAAFLDEAAARRVPLSRVLVFSGPAEVPVPSPRTDVPLHWFRVAAAKEPAWEEVSRLGPTTVYRLDCRLPGPGTPPP